MATPRRITAKAAARDTIWDPVRRVFIVDGKVITRDKLRGWLQQTLRNGGEALKELAAQRFNNELSHVAWEAASVEEITNLHTSLAIVANGGIEQMTDAAWERLADVLKDQIEDHFYGSFSQAVEADELSEAQMVARADQYAGSGWSTYQNELRASSAAAGDFDEEMRVLSDANNCETCLEQAGHWEEIGTLNDIGDSECQAGCQCEFIFRSSGSGLDEGE